MVLLEWQGVGLGTALQVRLQEYAMSRGVRGLVSEILARNISMLRLAARASGTAMTRATKTESTWPSYSIPIGERCRRC
jgi:hypothetical protein